MKLLHTVNIHGFSPQMVLALIVCNDIYQDHGQELVVTCGTEGKHSATSLHYSGNAADLRTNYFSESEKQQVKQEIRDRLPRDFDVVLEATHIHVEYQPKYWG